MKRILIVVIMLISIFTLISCKDNNNDSNSDIKTNPDLDDVESLPVDTVTPAPETPLITIDYKKTVDMTYEFVGDEKDKAGFAQGYIKIKPLAGAKTKGFYLVYLADYENILTSYDEFASFEITGFETEFYVKDGRYLPVEARKLVVFESTSRSLYKAPNIKDAACIIDLPKSKRLDLGEIELTLGATSDIHINFEGLNFGSKNKWTNMLKFFENNNAEYVIVTGDMTGDGDIEGEYQYYKDEILKSSIPFENVFESLGNHGNSDSTLNLFSTYTLSDNETHPYPNSPYYYVMTDDNLFIFMWQEISGPSDSAAYDNFSKAQMDWLEELLKTYGNTDINIFLTIHSPFLNFGPGDRHNGDYVRMITFKEEYTQTMRLKGLLSTYKDVIVLSGHTHLTYYEGENYSNENDSFARMIHVSSGTQTSSYNHGSTLISDTDGRYPNSPTYGSEAYIVKIYKDYILFLGYNVSTNKIIPAGAILLPTKAYGGTYKEPTNKEDLEINPVDIYEVLEGSGTQNDPYLISNENEFRMLTDAFNKSVTTVEAEMFGYGKYFKQTNDLDMTINKLYKGTTAYGSDRATFAGFYDGDGHTIKVDLKGGYNQSIFPYVYGTIANLKVVGNISGTVCAQPIRALYGNVINSIFNVNCQAEQTAGIIYSNYGYVCNVYVNPTLSGNAKLVSVNDNSTKYYNIYYSNNSYSSNYATYNANISNIVNLLNDRTNENYLTASKYLSTFKEMVSINGEIDFK